VEGYADPTGYCDAKTKGQPTLILSRIKQSANNTSLNRAVQVREAIVNYARSKGVALDPSQPHNQTHPGQSRHSLWALILNPFVR